MRTKKSAKRHKFNLSYLNGLKQIDRTLIFLIFGFLIFGLVIIYDATAVLSQDIYGFAYRFVFLQLVWIILGLLSFSFFALIDMELLKKMATPIFVATTFILFLLGVFGVLPCDINFMFAPCINGANRWFYLNPSPLPTLPLLGILGFQPSELAKLSLVIFLSALLAKNRKRNDRDSFILYIFVTGLSAFLIYLQPNLSTAALLFVIGTAIYVASDSGLKPLLYLLPLEIAAALLFIVTSPYRRARLLTFLSADGTSGELAAGYHIRQIQIALGSGGLFGLGFGQSRQKFLYLPEVFADSIFAIIGEELGFLGTSVLVIAFGFFIYKGYEISKKTDNYFSRLLAVGVTTWLGMQFFVNVSAMLKIIPLTGIPLPLISYGGSSLVFILTGLGILANVSRSSSKVT